MKKVILKDVAKRAMVDISTVSRALTGSPLLKEKTKREILALAEELGYYPNVLARGLASKKSQNIGLVLPDMTALQGPFYTEVLRGIEQRADESDYSLLLTTVKDRERSKTYLPLIKGRRMDGFLLINEHITIEELNFLVNEDIAFIVLERFFKEPGVNCVISDNTGGARSAVSYLIEQGHKRIGFITGERTFCASRDRIKGYIQALKENKIPLNESLVIEGSFQNGITSGYACAMELFSRTSRPTAIFAGNDEIAMGVFQAVRDVDLKVPKDISVIGFDDAPFAAHLTPPLTTVRQFGYEIGYQACEMLIGLLNKNPIETNKIKVPTELIIRDSCRNRA